MKTNNKKGENPRWPTKYLLVGSGFWMLATAIALHLVRNETEGKWGQFGDLFGWFGTLVSILGFVMVLHQLRQNHQEAEKAGSKHKEILDKQQDLFEQNTKIQLFEKRYELRQQFFELFEDWNKTTYPDSQRLVRKAQYLALKATYLFSNVSILEALNEYLAKCAEIETAVKNFYNLQDATEKSQQAAHIVNLLNDLAEIGHKAQGFMGEQLRIQIDSSHKLCQHQSEASLNTNT